jgi:5-(carboxyamino)imidazole ribonucleotide synthase
LAGIVNHFLQKIELKKVGIVGGGQLGRMLIQAATDWNLEIHILDPDENAPCKDIANRFVVAERTDADAVFEFGKDLDVVTIEIENVSVEGLQRLADSGVDVYPQPSVIQTIKDKRLQKQFYLDNDIPTSPFILTENKAEVEANVRFLPAFQKLGTGGYDGQGVQQLAGKADLAKAFDAPSLLEKAVDIEKEISVIAARNKDGEVVTFPTTEMVFDPKYNLVDYLLSPAQVSPLIAAQAEAIAEKVILAYDMVGILAIEMFLTKDGNILVNEVAPRPHNSGHQTIEGNFTSQFQQHLRAILNLPLGNTAIRTQSAMVNVIGADGYKGDAHYDGVENLFDIEDTYLHLYGKKLTKPGRKMGHITILEDDLEALKAKIETVKAALVVKTK